MSGSRERFDLVSVDVTDVVADGNGVKASICGGELVHRRDRAGGERPLPPSVSRAPGLRLNGEAMETEANHHRHATFALICTFCDIISSRGYC